MIIASPTPQNERAVIVDIVRGFALVGVLIANFTGYNHENTPPGVFNAISSTVDKSLVTFNAVFLEWKFMTIFSILFGYGFGLIISSVEKKGIDPTPFFIRRMFWLFIIGAIHTLFWWGDVLHFYAISGVLLLAFRKFSAKIILILSLVCMLVIPPLVSFVFRFQPEFFTDQNVQLLYEQYKGENVLDLFKANMIIYYKAFIVTGGDIHDIIETLGRFLFGYFLLRVGLFESIETKKRLFKKTLFITAPVMIAYFVIRLQSLNGDLNTDEAYWEPVLKTGILFTACFYSSCIVLLFTRSGETIFSAALQALGKMTLTNYLLVSAVMTIVFSGIGFALLGVLTMRIIWMIAFVWLMIEITFSIYWLNKYRFGPVEWIWRQLTYRKRIELRKQV